MTWPFENLIPLRYQVILADIPWDFELRSAAGEGKSPQAHYGCMSLDDIKAMPVNHLASRDCLLVLWGTWPMAPQAFEVMKAWGFRYVTGGPWAKRSRTGKKWAFGTGYVLRSAAEFFILGTVGHPEYLSKSERNLIVAPIRRHSEKPNQMHEMIERLVDGPYCELFGRKTRKGWDVWGNEVGKLDEVAA